jgi:geranylgeranylglycerol-phosphate geranylgeranyltransferase
MLMACCAVALGAWLSGAGGGPWRLVLMLLAAAAAVAFGNVVNDLRDIETDKVSHPGRPLADGSLTVTQATVYAVLLALVSLAAGLTCSPLHGAATLVPLALLLCYAFTLKGVPLGGNLIVAALVAYPLVYGGLTAPGRERLWIPAALAALLNLSREIVKDLQDEGGDRSAGLRTTAVLPRAVPLTLLAVAAIGFLLLLFMPVRLSHFGTAYGIVCAVVVVPLHTVRNVLFFGSRSYGHVSLLIKLEMLAGLVAMAADQLLSRFS